MAFTKVEINKDTWTLITGEANTTTITFQNASQFPLYINFGTSANTELVTDNEGLVYAPWQGELKVALTDLTFQAGPTHVFAKSASRDGSVIVEYE